MDIGITGDKVYDFRFGCGEKTQVDEYFRLGFPKAVPELWV